MNRSPNPFKKSTLIVAPLALLDQWQAEIDEKTDLGLRCLIYHGMSINITYTREILTGDRRQQQGLEPRTAAAVRCGLDHLPGQRHIIKSHTML